MGQQKEYPMTGVPQWEEVAAFCKAIPTVGLEATWNTVAVFGGCNHFLGASLSWRVNFSGSKD